MPNVTLIENKVLLFLVQMIGFLSRSGRSINTYQYLINMEFKLVIFKYTSL